MPDNAIIVSDLHLGSRYFLFRQFEQFLSLIPEDHELILNGDVVDCHDTKLPESHSKILDLLLQISRRQRVVWVRGNHDEGYKPERFSTVLFANAYNLGRKLLIVHGDDFDEIMPRNKLFIRLFNMLHELRIRLGARPVHVAKYAKKWKPLYDILRKNIMTNAVKCARETGYEAVTCGHSHYPEYRVHNGIKYINTGSWTEFPGHYLQVTGGEMFLRRFVNKCDCRNSGWLCPEQVLKPVVVKNIT